MVLEQNILHVHCKRTERREFNSSVNSDAQEEASGESAETRIFPADQERTELEEFYQKEAEAKYIKTKPRKVVS